MTSPNPYQPVEPCSTGGSTEWTDYGELVVPRGTKEVTLPRICIHSGSTNDLWAENLSLHYRVPGQWVHWVLMVLHSVWTFFLPSFFVRGLVSYLAGGILLFGLIWFLTARKVKVKSYVQLGGHETVRRPTFWRLIAQALPASLCLIGTSFFMSDWLRAIERWLPMRLTLTIGHLPWYVAGSWWKKPGPLTIRVRSGLLAIAGFSENFPQLVWSKPAQTTVRALPYVLGVSRACLYFSCTRAEVPIASDQGKLEAWPVRWWSRDVVVFVSNNRSSAVLRPTITALGLCRT